MRGRTGGGGITTGKVLAAGRGCRDGGEVDDADCGWGGREVNFRVT